MSDTTSAYQAFTQLLADQGHHIAPAELHGLLVGRTCAGAGFDPQGWLADAQLLFGEDVPSHLHPALTGLQAMIKSELGAHDCMAITLLLPSDEDSLLERTVALSHWCQGFLSGFGTSIGERKLSDDVQEILKDFVAIAQLDTDNHDAADDDESSFMEISEYLRMSAVFMFTEFAPAPAAPSEETPAVH